MSDFHSCEHSPVCCAHCSLVRLAYERVQLPIDTLGGISIPFSTLGGIAIPMENLNHVSELSFVTEKGG